MVRMQDIADKLGISKGTVSKALNGTANISDELQKKVIETAVELGYTKKLRRPKNEERKLCVLIDNIDYKEPHQIAYDIILGFRQMAEPAGYTVDVVQVNGDAQKEESYEMFMRKHNYLGSFLMGFALSAPWAKDLQSNTTPAVLYDNYVPTSPMCANVGIDNYEGMKLAVSYLKRLGHRKIGYLSTSLGSYVMKVRNDAFFSALQQEGLDSNPEYAQNSLQLTECMEKLLPMLLDLGVTAIICCHDQMAHAAILQCQQMGYHVPKDISILGFDDLPFCAYTSPPITTIRQDRIQIGKSGYYALESLMNQISIGTLLLHAKLIERSSVANLEQ